MNNILKHTLNTILTNFNFWHFLFWFFVFVFQGILVSSSKSPHLMTKSRVSVSYFNSRVSGHTQTSRVSVLTKNPGCWVALYVCVIQEFPLLISWTFKSLSSTIHQFTIFLMMGKTESSWNESSITFFLYFCIFFKQLGYYLPHPTKGELWCIATGIALIPNWSTQSCSSLMKPWYSILMKLLIHTLLLLPSSKIFQRHPVERERTTHSSL